MKYVISADGKPVLFPGCRLWVFLHKWIYETCMYIVFIQIIYVVSRKKQRTIQCRLYLCAEHIAVSLWIENPEANRRAPRGLPSPRETQHMFALWTWMGINLFWTTQVWQNDEVGVYLRHFLEQNGQCVGRKVWDCGAGHHTHTEGWHTPCRFRTTPWGPQEQHTRAVGLTSPPPVVCTAGNYWPVECPIPVLWWAVFEGQTGISNCWTDTCILGSPDLPLAVLTTTPLGFVSTEPNLVLSFQCVCLVVY